MLPRIKKYAMHGCRYVALGVAFLAVIGATCQERATEARARLADDRIAAEICSVWTPITDTTSPQVRSINKARYAFCEGDLPNPGENR